jgi:hypothetical protein
VRAHSDCVGVYCNLSVVMMTILCQPLI